METLKELKSILDNAPDGATHVQVVESENQYFESNGFGFWCLNSGCQVASEDVVFVRSLSDINRIIELMELNQNMHATVAGYLCGKDWAHWNEFNAGKFKL